MSLVKHCGSNMEVVFLQQLPWGPGRVVYGHTTGPGFAQNRSTVKFPHYVDGLNLTPQGSYPVCVPARSVFFFFFNPIQTEDTSKGRQRNVPETDEDDGKVRSSKFDSAAGHRAVRPAVWAGDNSDR